MLTDTLSSKGTTLQMLFLPKSNESGSPFRAIVSEREGGGAWQREVGALRYKNEFKEVTWMI